MSNITQELLSKLELYPPSDYGHSLHYNLIGHRTVKPLTAIPGRIAGRAITVQITPNDSILVYKALQNAKNGDIIVIDMSGEERYACWGEITTRVAMAKGVKAAIINGPATDSTEIKKLGFPVYSKTISPLTTKVYHLEGYLDIPVSIDNVVINSGDYIVSDNDGILVIPQNDVEKYLEIGEQEYLKDTKRKEDLENFGVDRYLENLGL
ncbi:Oxaloacetate decarboxylase OS=Ureibacillus acetophenoni OX=614649 GN=SAMN05877842_12239 PE=3 SV=1 [Ureibacillus acetophenoni]